MLPHSQQPGLVPHSPCPSYATVSSLSEDKRLPVSGTAECFDPHTGNIYLSASAMPWPSWLDRAALNAGSSQRDTCLTLLP